MDQQLIHPELARAIHGYVRAGYLVTEQTATTAQLVRPKRFSCLWATLWLCVFLVGLLVYVFYYMSKKDETIYLQVVNDRLVTTRGK